MTNISSDLVIPGLVYVGIRTTTKSSYVPVYIIYRDYVISKPWDFRLAEKWSNQYCIQFISLVGFEKLTTDQQIYQLV